MAKDKLTDYDSTASGNLDVGGVSVAEGMLPSGVNNAIRELMSHQADAFGAGTPLYVDQTNNRLGVGTGLPARGLHLNNNGESFFRITSSDTGNAGIEFGDQSDGVQGAIFQNSTDNSLRFNGYNNSEAMRIDSSGNLLVGKTVANASDVGVVANASGRLFATASSHSVFNRTTDDGKIVEFRKDNVVVGSIGVEGGDNFYFVTGSTPNTGLNFKTNFIIPCSASASVRDNAIDLGASSARFDDIFATNGTIQTSDANEKQQIASLTAAEITAATAISKLFKTFKWNDKVAEKGDAARTHTGVIAQDVEAAMTDAGLDAGDYAFFISTTWWETQTDVPAVEAVAEVLDEDGNVVTEAVEAVDAYTRTDTYETAEEAPEGATERTRLGIRYPELLAFVGAATEQRLADIETRLTALENA